MNIQLTLALRYLSGRKLRTLLTTLAIMFGILVIFSMNLILPTFINAMQANLLATSGQVDLTITHVTGNPFDETLLAKVAAVNGVRAVSGSLNHVINLPANYFDHDAKKADLVSALNLLGVDPQTANTIRPYSLMSGRFLTTEDKQAVVITGSLADHLGLNLGDTLTIPGSTGQQKLTIVGILFPRLVPGNEELLVPLQQAQIILNDPGKVNVIEANLAVDSDPAVRESIRADVLAAIGQDFKIGQLTTGEEYLSILKIGQIIMNLFGALALFTGAFTIYNTFRTVILERRHDIGLLRAVGASRRMILQIIIIEGSIQGLLGAILGILLGYALSVSLFFLAQVPMKAFLNLNVGVLVISPLLVGICLLIGIGISVVSGLIPAIQASRITPMDALRPSFAEVSIRRQTKFGSILGLGLGAVALIFLFSKNTVLLGLGAFLFLIALVCIIPIFIQPLAKGFGWLLMRLFQHQGSAELAKGNLTRNTSRSAITVSATMICLAVIVAAGGFITSIRYSLGERMQASFHSDYLFIPPSITLWSNNIGANQSFAESLREIKGVGDISSLRFSDSMVEDNAVTVIGLDPDVFPRVSSLDFSQGDDTAYQKMKAGRYMAVNQIFVITTGHKVGDTVNLASTNGVQPYQIVAVGGDLMNTKTVSVYLSQTNLERDFNASDDFFIQLNLLPGADAETVDQQIVQTAANYPQFTIIRGKAFLASFMAQIQAAFVGLYFLLALLALPSLVAMLNTLAISVIERTREIGMLRAVGATRKQIRSIITLEAVLLALIGTTFGILSGLYLGLVFVDATNQMLSVVYQFPISGILAGLITGVLFGILAAIIPARQAARLNVVQALRYE